MLGFHGHGESIHGGPPYEISWSYVDCSIRPNRWLDQVSARDQPCAGTMGG